MSSPKSINGDTIIIPSTSEESTTYSSSSETSTNTAPSSTGGFLSPPASPEPEKNNVGDKNKMISGTTITAVTENLNLLVTPRLSPTSSYSIPNNENQHPSYIVDLPTPITSTTSNTTPVPISQLSTEDHFKTFTSSYDIHSLDQIAQKTTSHLTQILSTNHHTPTMIPTCMSSLPTGNEKGTFLSVDLGGSTFRVAFVTLNGKENSSEIIYMSVVPVPDSIKQGTGEDFFLWMGHEVKKGVDKVLPNHPKSIPIHMGISWSFPFIQTAMETAFLEKMGKGYNVADEIAGWNLGSSFEQAFNKLGLNIKVTAIVNDGGACMISRAYYDDSTKISLILGTGINAGIMVPSHLIGKAKLASLSVKSEPSYMINTEISMLNDRIVPDTLWDIELDAAIERPGFQPLETKVSGRYLGEISRLIIRDMINNNGLCNGTFPIGLDIPYGLESWLMSDIEEHYRNNRMDLAIEAFCKSHPHPNLTESDMIQICSIFVAVSTRSAGFTASVLVGLADILYKGTKSASKVLPSCTIAYTGTVIEKYPLFRERCQQYLDSLSKSRGIQLRLESSENGSIFGPVIAAAMGDN